MSKGIIKLSDILIPQPKSKIKAGEGKNAGKYKFFTSSNSQTKFVDEYQYDGPALIFGTGGNANIHFCEEKFATSTDCLVFRAEEKQLLKSVYLYLSGNMQVLENGFKGAGLTHISKQYILDISFLLPEANEQRKIAAVLDKVSSLIAKRRQQLDKLDEMVKARFVEMFGNFVYERDRWSICKVGDVADTVDPQPSHRTPPISADGIPYIGIAECNYKTRLIDFEKARKVGQNVLQEHLERYTLDEGDFIIGKIGTIGKPFFVPTGQTYTLSANTVLIKPYKKRVTPHFLFAVFQSEYMDRIIDAEKKSTSQPAFGIQKVRKIDIPIPPLELQNQFAAFVEQTEKTKTTISESLEKLETLKKALMQKYFGRRII